MFRFFTVIVSLLRVALAASLVFICAQALPSWDAAAALMALPNYNYLAQAEALRKEERYSEALLVTDAGMRAELPLDTRALLLAEQARIAQERDDWKRRLADAGQGALTGTGNSVEALAGAVTADLFVFGDIRDLIIQGGHQLRGEEVDEVIVGLSAAGIVLTAAPAADFGTAVLKFARRVGALSEAFVRQLRRLLGTAVEQGDVAPLADLASDTASLARSAQPAAAVAILKNIDDPLVLKASARLASQPGGSFALWVGERPALELLKAGTSGETLLMRAAAKGKAGVQFAADNLVLLVRPHPLLGVLKSMYRYNLPRLFERLLATQAPLVLGLLFGWLIFECLLMAHRLGAKRPEPEAQPLVRKRVEPRTRITGPVEGRREPRL